MKSIKVLLEPFVILGIVCALTLGLRAQDSRAIMSLVGVTNSAGDLHVHSTATTGVAGDTRAIGNLVGHTDSDGSLYVIIADTSFADGDATTPSIGFVNDTDTGAYRIGANNMGFSAGGTLRWDYNTTRITTTLPLIFTTDNAVDIGANGATRPRRVYAGTDVIVAGSSVTTGVATGYKVARGSTALDGSNPTTVATGLTSVVSCTGTLLRSTALTTGTAFLTHDAASGANVDFYAWILAGTASTGTEVFEWVCVGT